ncbi:MAG: MetS family NSS transporter small subunit [Calditrichota bacterium]|jgi:preprotein translocase subunit YajC
MNIDAIIIMIIMLLAIWGGFFYFLHRAYQREKNSGRSGEGSHDQ